MYIVNKILKNIRSLLQLQLPKQVVVVYPIKIPLHAAGEILHMVMSIEEVNDTITNEQSAFSKIHELKTFAVTCLSSLDSRGKQSSSKSSNRQAHKLLPL